MKTVNDKQQIWFERSNNVVTVGFTKDFLDSLDQCWHILPANLSRFREKAPLMVVETNDSLISILSPVTAHFAHWSDKAQNFPYKLTEGDVVLEMNVTEARKPVVQRATQMQFTVGAEEDIRIDPMDWAEAAPITLAQRNAQAEAQIRAQLQAQAMGNNPFAAPATNATAPVRRTTTRGTF